MATSYTLDQDLTLVLADGTTYDCHSIVLSRLDDVVMMLERPEMVEVAGGKRHLKLPPQLTKETVECVLGSLYRKALPELTSRRALALLEETRTMRSVWKLLSREVDASMQRPTFAAADITRCHTLFEFYVESDLVPSTGVITVIRCHLDMVSARHCYTMPVAGRCAMATFISRVGDPLMRQVLFAAWIMSANYDELTKENVEAVRSAVGDGPMCAGYRQRVDWLQRYTGPIASQAVPPLAPPKAAPTVVPSQPAAVQVSPERKREAESAPDHPSKKAK
jgi:hypothetical protein